MATFCWLPPERRRSICPGPVARTPRRAITSSAQRQACRWPNRLQREKLLSALTARFIAIGSSMKMPSLRRSSGTSARPRPHRVGRIARSPRLAVQLATLHPAFCWRRTALCTARFCPRRPARRYPEFPLPAGAAKYPASNASSCRPSTCNSTSSPCGGAAVGRYRSARGPASFRRSVRRSAAPSGRSQLAARRAAPSGCRRSPSVHWIRCEINTTPDPCCWRRRTTANRRSLSC